ncbi:uncharacterized protein [Rutidosis leptorrhynchoides]|uniref:uncharacterized protein n=1 Tax=Rutidosis leptorrhynchoides TaxID=125765 RepID=UPI003A9A156E
MNIECPWEIYVSKVGKSETWQVKTFHDKHKCLFSRDIPQCTYEFLASKLVDKIPSNPNLPTKAVKVQFESEYGVNITKQKAYRALKLAIKTVKGDYQEQYSHLRDYLLELVKCNPDTTVHVQTEQCDPDLPTRVFKRDLKRFNEGCWDYLVKIKPQHWARSHFSGRAKTDILLNNMCEVLNRWLVDGRDKPIITALEFIREYLMKRIVNVRNTISKCSGPLTPGATKVFEGIKKEAEKYTVMFSGSNTYQVNGPHDDQCVVDMEHRSCVCRKWELTGMPCKHVVAVLWNMFAYDKRVGPPESWVHPVHRLETWKKTCTFTIDPLSGREHWPKSTVPTKLMPPLKIATAGRPKKNRRKELDEKESMVKDGKLSKKGGTTQCSMCKEFGHNKRGCTNGGASKSGSKRCDNGASESGVQKKMKGKNG